MYVDFTHHIQSLFDLMEATENGDEFSMAWTILCDFEDEIQSIFLKNAVCVASEHSEDK